MSWQCPICKGKLYITYKRGERAEYYTCHGCTVIFADPKKFNLLTFKQLEQLPNENIQTPPLEEVDQGGWG